jgi:RNA polymerase sigma factor (sigma-70 family)
MLPDAEGPLKELLQAIRAGRRDSARQFMARYGAPLREGVAVRGVVKRLQGRLDSEDLVQSVLLKAIEEIRAERVEFADEGALQSYLTTLGRNQLRDKLRRINAAKREGRRGQAPGTALESVRQPGPSPSAVASVKEEVARVEAVADPADLAMLRDRVNGAGWEELARQIGTTPEAVRKRLERVRRRIREALAAPSSASNSVGNQPGNR